LSKITVAILLLLAFRGVQRPAAVFAEDNRPAPQPRVLAVPAPSAGSPQPPEPAPAPSAGSQPPTPAALAHPEPLTKALADSLASAILAVRAETAEWLRSKPSSYLATIARNDFEEKTTLVVGSAPDADVRIEASDVKPHHLRVTVEGDSFRVEALDPGAGFRIGGKDTTYAVTGPASVQAGRYMLRLSHQRFPAIIVFDPESPRFKDYKGLDYFPVDFDYRFVLPLTPNEKPDTTVIMSTRGNARRAVRVGWFDFAISDTPCRLEAVRLLEPGVDEGSVSVFFTDATTGKETYEVGRYVDPEKRPDGRWLLDFNRAYNPACAFSVHYNCPIPSSGNHLPVAIRAGEKDAHYAHEASHR
jgi:uncharacterized protein (DUF1684 family)